MSNELVGSVAAIVLGIMQDAGLPHIGCLCARCVGARERAENIWRAACLALVDARQHPALVWLIDATPDIGRQLYDLGPFLGLHPRRPERLRPPDGIFLTHGHMGHVDGLAQLGPEGMAVEGLAIYASAGLAQVIRNSHIWRPLMAGLEWHILTPGEPLTLAPSLKLAPLSVPHRDEWQAGTFAFRIDGPNRSLLYCPDIDDWEAWPEARAQVSRVDVALLDATFYSSAELGGRPPVAHPLVPDTLAYFGKLANRLVLTHFNHTNPVLDEESAQRAHVLRAGASVARHGQVFTL